MGSEWADITFLAWENQKGICTICGRYIWLNTKAIPDKLIGHHIHNKSQGGLDILSNCEARHASPCEVWAHQVTPGGNPTKHQISEFRFTLDPTNK